MSSTRKLTCLICRQRKLKCDGIFPQCGRCRQGPNFQCKYEEFSRILARRALPKGEACIPCRRRKRKCDAQRPCCDSCTAAGTQDKCEYKWTKGLFTIIPAAYFTTKVTAEPLLDTFTEFETSSRDTHLSPPPFDGPDIPLDNPDLLFVNPSRPFVNSEIPFHNSIPQFHDNMDTWACSHVSLDDVNMNLRLAFLYRRYQVGFYLPIRKHQAIVLGDLSGIFVHRFFIDSAHTGGAALHYEEDPSFRYLFMINTYLESLWQSMADIEQQDDPFVLAQACNNVYVSFMHMGHFINAKCYLRRTISIVNKHRIRFLGDEDPFVVLRPLQYSEEAHERSAFLARLIYAEVVLQLTTGEVWNKSADLELQFRSELPIAHPVLFKMCPIILSVRSILFVKDVRALVPSLEESESSIQLKTLYYALTTHISSTLSDAAGPYLSSDHEARISVHCSIIICLTAKAELCLFLAKNSACWTFPPIDWDTACELALGAIVNMTSQMADADVNLADPFLSTSWASVIEILNERPPLLQGLTIDPCTPPLDDSLFIITSAKAKLEKMLNAGPTLLREQVVEIHRRLQPANNLLDLVRVTYDYDS